MTDSYSTLVIVATMLVVGGILIVVYFVLDAIRKKGEKK